MSDKGWPFQLQSPESLHRKGNCLPCASCPPADLLNAGARVKVCSKCYSIRRRRDQTILSNRMPQFPTKPLSARHYSSFIGKET